MKPFIMATGLSAVLALGLVVSLPEEQPTTWLVALQVPVVHTSTLTSLQ